MTQPLRGVAASILAMALALGFVSLFDFATFTGPVSFVMLCLIPAQVTVVAGGGAKPAFLGRMGQPARGLTLMALTVAVGLVATAVILRVVGEGMSPPGPVPAQFAVIAVPTAFYLCIAFGGWPFTARLDSPVLAGSATLVAAYLVNAVVFRLFFDYSFLQGTPVYLPSAPHGFFSAPTALVFYVTVLAGMFVVIHFDMWPIRIVPALMTQPVLGLVWLLLAIAQAAVAFQIGVAGLGTDPMVFLARTVAPFIFGTIIVLNMLQNSLFATLTQPAKGVANVLAAAVIGVVLSVLHGLAAPAIVGPLASGPPGYEYELWLVNALLSVTFPALIFVASYFEYWPLK